MHEMSAVQVSHRTGTLGALEWYYESTDPTTGGASPGHLLFSQSVQRPAAENS